jgi:HAD superfamily hydrolase (TIGR01509 family)
MYSKEINKFLDEKGYSTFDLKAVFFDMDGVLFDSMKYHVIAWIKALQKIGVTFTEQQAYLNEGRTGASTIDEVFINKFGRNATEDEKQNIYSLKSEFFEECGEIEQIPFSHELLKLVKSQNLAIFVVTGSGQTSLLESLEKNFPNIFRNEKMVTAYDVKQGKPHPEPYLTALEKSGLKANQVVVIENAPLGIESAVAAGLFTIAINTGPLNPQVLTDSGANIVFDGMKELYLQWNNFVKN